MSTSVTGAHCPARVQPPLWCWNPCWSVLGHARITSTKMKHLEILLLWCSVHRAFSAEMQQHFEQHSSVQLSEDTEARGRRDVIEEEKFYNTHTENRKDNLSPTPWMPHGLLPEDPTTKISITNDEVKVLPLYQTTERVTDKPTGRGARASNENWIKLPYPGRDDSQDDILTPPQPSGDLINSRMPRVNFVTQSKQLETSESRNDKESIQRPGRNNEIRTDFVRPGEEDRSKLYKPVHPRQAMYYPEESQRYPERYMYNELYRRDPMYDLYDRRRVYPGYGPRIDRLDDGYDVIPRKPKRIIYYAHLPEVVRSPPSVDLRNRYPPEPYQRVDDEYYGRTGRYDYRFRNRYPYPGPYPYAPLRKEERNYRDLTGAGTQIKDKKPDQKVTPTPILPKKQDNTDYKNNINSNRNVNRNVINSHQYHDGPELLYTDPMTHKAYQDVVRYEDGYLRYDEPLFQSAVEDPYLRKY